MAHNEDKPQYQLGLHHTSSPRLIHIVGANRWDEPWRHALDVCRHFRSLGWSVTAYTRDAKAIDSRFRAALIDIRHCPLRGLFDVYSALQLSRDLRQERYGTIVHVHRYRDAFAVLLARRLAGRRDIRVVSTRHKLKRGAAHALAQRIYRNLDAQTFVSRSVRDRFLTTWPDGNYPFDASRLHVISPAVNIPDTPPVAEADKGPRVVLCRAPLLPGMGLETLIDSLTALRELKTRLRIVSNGDTDYIDVLRRRAQVRGVMDMIDWKLRPDDTYPLIDQCHIGVDPTLRGAPFGPTHIEYMARQRAQVITAAISPSEHITDGSQVLIVPPGDAYALGEALRRLVIDSDLRHGIAAAARQTYLDHFSWDECAETIRRLYASIQPR